MEVVVEALTLHQLVVRALLDEPSLLEHRDRVGVADRAEPVSDDHGGALFEHPVEVALDRRLGLGVESARGLVEQQDRRIVVERAGDADALSLSAGELGDRCRPTFVSYPSAMLSMNPAASAISAARWTRARSGISSPSAMFRAIVSSKRYGA